jgi:predicted PurR-regulated permease PerM
VPSERVVSFRPRAVLQVLGVAVAVGLLLWLIWVARYVLAWVFISLFLALALNPAVEWLHRRVGRRRALATGLLYGFAVALVAGIAAVFIPRLVDEVNDFAKVVPGYLEDLTSGRGPLGFLQDRYQIVDKARDAFEGGAPTGLVGGAGTALDVTRGIVTALVGIVTIIFMTFFMLVEGPAWMERLYGLLPPESQPRWRAVGRDIYRTVSGYVTGNLLVSVIAGVAATVVLTIMGVPYAAALGLLVAVLDLIPLAGATLAAIVVTVVAFLSSTTAGIVVLVFFIVYQQLENHLLQPLVYGRTVKLSPLAILISVLIGAEVAGILGALAAIPVAGTIQVLLVDWSRHRRARGPRPSGEAAAAPANASETRARQSETGPAVPAGAEAGAG